MRSMTGMGKSRGKAGGNYYQVEMKAVNHRYCEVNVRLPSKLQSLEVLIAQRVKKKISRGKVDLWIGEEKTEVELELNKKSLKNYYQLLSQVKKEVGLKEEITLVHLQAGTAFWMNKEIDSEKTWPKLKNIIDEATSSLIEMRETEGSQVKKQLINRVDQLEKLTHKVSLRKNNIVKEYQQKLELRVQKILEQVELDQAKLANELAFFADKSDVSEEIDRLVIHYQHMKKLMDQKNKPIGRSLDFLIQEINREWNTLSSKTSDAKVAHDVVMAKSELEKIREQVQNVE